MSRLEEIKDQYALEVTGDLHWHSYSMGGADISNRDIDEIAKRYARECCIATQNACAENAHVEMLEGCIDEFGVDKESITNPDNIVLL